MSNGIWIKENQFVSFADMKNADMSREIATRESVDYGFGAMTWLPNPDPILKSNGNDISVYRDIQTDAHVRGCIKNRKAGVLSLEWGIDRGNTRSRQAAFIQTVFSNLKIYQIISEMLNAPQFGYSVHEIIWGQMNGYWAPVAIIEKPQEWFHFDKNNGLRLKSSSPEGIPVPERKFVVARQEPSYNNPYGVADLSSCFWPTVFMKGGLRYWVKFIEKYGMPFAYANTPRGTDAPENKRVLGILKAMIQDACAVFPEDTKINFLAAEGSEKSPVIYGSFIDFCQKAISVVQLGHQGSTQSTPGQLGDNQTAVTVRGEIVDSDRHIVEDAMNQIIQWIFDLNFTGDMPTFSMWPRQSVNKAQAEVDSIICKDMGYRLKPEYVSKTYNIPIEALEPIAPAQVSLQQPASFSEGQGSAKRPIDQLIDKASTEADFSELYAPIKTLLNKAKSLDELRDGIIELYGNMDTKPLSELMQAAFSEAELMGRYEVKERK